MILREDSYLEAKHVMAGVDKKNVLPTYNKSNFIQSYLIKVV